MNLNGSPARGGQTPTAGTATYIRDAVLLPRALMLFLRISAILTLAALLFSLVCRELGLGLPYSFAYYFVPGDLFSDFRAFWIKFQAYPQPAFFPIPPGTSCIPRLCCLCCWLFSGPATLSVRMLLHSSCLRAGWFTLPCNA